MVFVPFFIVMILQLLTMVSYRTRANDHTFLNISTKRIAFCLKAMLPR